MSCVPIAVGREFRSGGVRGRESRIGNMRVKGKPGVSSCAFGLPSHHLGDKLGRTFFNQGCSFGNCAVTRGQ